jgi:hypothetical protein
MPNFHCHKWGRIRVAQDSPEESKWRNTFRTLMDETPTSYPSRYQQLAAMSDVFHEELARQVGNSLNPFLASQPEPMLNQAMADQVGRQLSQIHLAPRCPRSGRPARLVIDSIDSPGCKHRKFGLVVTDENGQSFRTFSQRKLPELDLMQDDQLRSPKLSSRLRRTSPGEPQR